MFELSFKIERALKVPREYIFARSGEYMDSDECTQLTPAHDVAPRTREFNKRTHSSLGR